MRAPSGLFALAAAICFGTVPSAAQKTITVRVVKAGNGKPLRGYHVWLQYPVAAQRKLQRVTQQTAANGMANFQIEEPLPERIFVSLGIDEAACSGQADVITDELLERGAAIGKDCGLTETAKRLSPKPGQIILFVRPLPLWARILAPIERE